MIRNYRSGYEAALTICFIEGDIASLQCCGRSSQAVGNLHETGQVLLTVYEVAVGQLARQCVQYVVNAGLVVHCNTGVVGNHGYYRSFCRMLDNSVACCVVFSCFTIAGMSIVNIGIAAVVVNGQAVSILLEDVACFSFACTANEVSDFTAGEFIFFPFGIAVYITILLIIPGSTVCHSQVHGTAQACFFFCIGEVFVCNTGPCGVFGGQLQVDNRFLAVARKFLALFAEETCITLNGNGLALAANINGTQSCAQSMEAIAVLIAVILDFDVGSAQVNSCTICCYYTGAMSCDSSLAVNSYACTCAVSVDAGNISPGGFAQGSSVLTFDNVIKSPFFSVLSHGQIAMQLNFGIAVSVNAVNIVIAMSLNSGIAGNLYHSLLACALSINADCAAFTDQRVAAAGLTAIGIINVDIQSTCSNACCAACNAVVNAAQRNSVVQNTCVFIRRNSLAVQSYVQLQSLVCSLNHQIFNACSVLYSRTADDEGAFPIRILFLMSHLVDINACVLSKYIGQVLLLYCAEYALLFTGDSIGKGSLFTTARIYSFFFGVALTGILIEFNGINLHDFVACGQAGSDLNRTVQVVFTVHKIAVGQLACQCIQYVSYTCIVIHADAGVVGNQANCGACCRTLDNGVACCVVACVFTIAGMCIENVSVAAIVINGQVIAVLLEDVACSSFACTASKLSYMAAFKCCIGFAPCLIVPGCAVSKIQVNDTLEREAAGTKILCKSCTCPGRLLVSQTDIDNAVGNIHIESFISFFSISTDVAFNYGSSSACCILICIHVDIHNAAIRLQSVEFLAVVLRNFNIAAADRNSRAVSDSSNRIAVTKVDISLTVYSDSRSFGTKINGIFYIQAVDAVILFTIS